MSRRIKKIKELENENLLEDIILDEYFDLPIVLPNLHLTEESTSEYLDERWFAIYFDAIIEKIFSTNKDICLFTSNYTIDYFIIIDFLNFKYYISELLAKSIEKCQDINNRFYILPIKLIFNYTDAHSNIIIIDNQKKTIEFLEPHGEFIDANLPYNTERYVLQIIDILFLAHPIDIRTYNFVNVQKNCPRGGLQTIQSEVNPGSGYCLAWSLLFINIKLYNLNVDSDYIIQYLLNSFSPDELNTYIKRFMGFLESSNKTKLYDDDSRLKIEYNIELSENDKKKISKRIYDLVNKLKSSTITEDERSLINKELVSYQNFPKFQDVYFESINLSSFARPDYYYS